MNPSETETTADPRLTCYITNQLFYECKRRVKEHRRIGDSRWRRLAIRSSCWRSQISKTEEHMGDQLAEIFQAFPTMQLWREAKRRWEFFVNTDSQFANLVYRCEAHILEILPHRNEKETDTYDPR